MLNYIEDGETRDGFVAPIPRLHDGARFKFRPTLSRERAIILDAMGNKSEPDGTDLAGAVLAERVQKWDVKRKNGDIVPLVPAHTVKIHPALLQSIYQIILGIQPSDPDPQAGPSGDPNEGARALEAALSGKPGPDTREGQEKNSGKG
jgi:hypothetical protein